MRIVSNRNVWTGITFVVFLAWCADRASQAAQTAPPKTVRIIGAKLTDLEVADLERALPPGGKPWLLIGTSHRALLPPGIQSIGAYMPPTTNLPELRRGSMIMMERNVSPAPPTSWTASKSRYEYAQVAIGGRSFDQITDEDDRNAPFGVTGAIDDADLIDVVKSVRSSEYGAFQVLRVMAPTGQPGNASVNLRGGGPGPSPGMDMTLILQKQGRTWNVAGARPSPPA